MLEPQTEWVYSVCSRSVFNEQTYAGFTGRDDSLVYQISKKEACLATLPRISDTDFVLFV